ncbi:MAG TPA: DUF5069 domain-containing protein [Candidatus Baltobacteraceae bacterium]|nr:DUF5069 domain-containing protein [Candidatus Baltobacteraceae bacterium]
MDLSKNPPRSAKDKIAGLTMAARTVDKAKAHAAGTTGEYNYDCPMDNKIFEFLGVDGQTFEDAVKNASDSQIEAYIKGLLAGKAAGDIAAFNERLLNLAPAPGSDGEKYFLDLRNQVAPDRTDVTTWPDLLDLDEKRQVPHRVAV